jgi:PAS domain S-box-containing protein
MATEDFKRSFDTLRVAVVAADPKGAVAFANAAFVELAAQDARTLLGTDLAGLFAPSDRRRVQQNVLRVGEGKAASAFLDARLSPHGIATRWVSLALQPWLDSRDKAAGVIAVLHDIGAQRETEAALNLVSARLLALTEASPLGFMVETEPGDVELANEAFCRLLGLEGAPQSLSGLPAREALLQSPWVEERLLDRMRA